MGIMTGERQPNGLNRQFALIGGKPYTRIELAAGSNSYSVPWTPMFDGGNDPGVFTHMSCQLLNSGRISVQAFHHAYEVNFGCLQSAANSGLWSAWVWV